MSVAGRGLNLSMPQEFAYHSQAFAERQRPTREAVPQVMNAYVFKVRPLADAPPGALEVGAVSAGQFARDDPRIVILAGNG